MEFLAVIGALALGYRDDSLRPIRGCSSKLRVSAFEAWSWVSYDDEVTQGEK